MRRKREIPLGPFSALGAGCVAAVALTQLLFGDLATLLVSALATVCFFAYAWRYRA